MQLFLSCRTLRDVDFIGVTDPQIHVYLRNKTTVRNKDGSLKTKGEPWTLVGSTELQKENLNPDFTKSITVPFFFEKHQYLKFVVVDGDNNNKEKIIGRVKTELGRICGAPLQKYTETILKNKLDSKKKQGILIVHADSVKHAEEEPINIRESMVVEENEKGR